MKKYSFLPILALVLGIAASAFTQIPNTVERWHLIDGKTMNDVTDPNSYELDDNSFTCPNTDVIPCVIQFDTDEYSSLEEYLSSKTASEVFNEAFSTRTN